MNSMAKIAIVLGVFVSPALADPPAGEAGAKGEGKGSAEVDAHAKVDTNGAKGAVKDAGKATAKAADKVGHEAKEAGKATANAVEKGGKATKDAAKSVDVKTTGDATAKHGEAGV